MYLSNPTSGHDGVNITRLSFLCKELDKYVQITYIKQLFPDTDHAKSWLPLKKEKKSFQLSAWMHVPNYGAGRENLCKGDIFAQLRN